MELILNEGSSTPYVANNINDAREKMKELLVLCRKAFSQGVSKNLRTKEDFRLLTLAPNYQLIHWLNDNQVDRETRQLFKLLITKSPYIDNIIEPEIYDRLLLSDFKLENMSVEGLGATYLLDGIAASFNNDEKWDSHFLKINMFYLDEEEDYITEEVEIRHISRLEHLDLHRSSMEASTVKFPINGKILWENRSDLFPALIFCDNAYKYIKELTFSQALFRQIYIRLTTINEYFMNWSLSTSLLEQFPFKLSPESESTLDNYKSQHTFKTPEGEDKLFSMHFRVTPMEWRIFFELDHSIMKAIIGHIGKKLPNVKYPT